jgi:hypothetical protein
MKVYFERGFFNKSKFNTLSLEAKGAYFTLAGSGLRGKHGTVQVNHASCRGIVPVRILVELIEKDFLWENGGNLYIEYVKIS